MILIKYNVVLLYMEINKKKRKFSDIVSCFHGTKEHIKLKIGIHNGRVISGVIGYHKPQFSLIGDTVNTTSRVCSTGIDGSITLSEEAFENIKNSNIECEQRVVQVSNI